MLSELKEILDKLRERQELRNSIILELLNSNIEIEGMKEKEFLYNVSKAELNYVIAGIDSSFLWQEFMTADILILRGFASIIEYSNNKKLRSYYYPQKLESRIILEEGLDIHELNCFKSLNRINLEFEIAESLVEKKLANAIFFDGSLIPLPMDKPEEESKLNFLYLNVIKKIIRTFNKARENNIILCAIAKDTRGKTIIDKAKKKYHSLKELYSSDITFLNDVMPENSRTSVFSYELRNQKKQFINPILRDLEKHGLSDSMDINVFYLRLSKMDKPIRIETILPIERISELSSIVASLCSINKTYTYPAVLIDADLKCKIDNTEMERIIRLMSLEYITKTRRTNRPFR